LASLLANDDGDGAKNGENGGVYTAVEEQLLEKLEKSQAKVFALTEQTEQMEVLLKEHGGPRKAVQEIAKKKLWTAYSSVEEGEIVDASLDSDVSPAACRLVEASEGEVMDEQTAASCRPTVVQKLKEENYSLKVKNENMNEKTLLLTKKLQFSERTNEDLHKTVSDLQDELAGFTEKERERSNVHTQKTEELEKQVVETQKEKIRLLRECDDLHTEALSAADQRWRERVLLAEEERDDTEKKFLALREEIFSLKRHVADVEAQRGVAEERLKVLDVQHAAFTEKQQEMAEAEVRHQAAHRARDQAFFENRELEKQLKQEKEDRLETEESWKAIVANQDATISTLEKQKASDLEGAQKQIENFEMIIRNLQKELDVYGGESSLKKISPKSSVESLFGAIGRGKQLGESFEKSEFLRFSICPETNLLVGRRQNSGKEQTVTVYKNVEEAVSGFFFLSILLGKIMLC